MGVELDSGVGQCQWGRRQLGVSGVRYFNCRPAHGVFLPTSKVKVAQLLIPLTSQLTPPPPPPPLSPSPPVNKRRLNTSNTTTSCFHGQNWKY
ncbi:hypothetical protein GBAR_LOCUS30845 [Geodia barretti]|uniref:CAP-Gly domain-containing protein n=1 Tax=Geodia barretti TaxID=519541 RepID=A0AA35XM58_GEOBA|nr:hypothetical protein GBAR_LOCUS30845 [Geodia barretti]